MGLAGLSEEFSDALEEEILARQIGMEQLAPLLGALMRLDYTVGNEFFASAGDGLTVQQRVTSVPFPSHGMVEFPVSLAVRNAIVLRLAWLSSGQSEFKLLHAHLNDLVGLVSAARE